MNIVSRSKIVRLAYFRKRFQCIKIIKEHY
jgi:hypothetical protein